MSVAKPAHSRELSQDDIEKVVKTINIPACPAIVMKVMSEAQRDEPNLNSLSRSIAADPAMVATVLKFANSPLFRGGASVTNVRKALDRLGTRNIVCVVVAAALRASMSGVPPAFIEQFWARTSFLADIAGQIARRQDGVPADAAFTYALFHNAGVPLMARRFPDYLELIATCRASGRLLVEAEGELLPCTHPVIGSIMVNTWGLPPMVGQAIRCHHEDQLYDWPDTALPAGTLSLIAVTQIAERLISEMNHEDDLEVGAALFERATAHFGIDEQDLDELRDTLRASQLQS